MAHKSKSQVRRARARKEARKNNPVVEQQAKKVETPKPSVKDTVKSTADTVTKVSNESKVMGYFRGVKTELARTTWPSKDETKNASFIVFGALLFFGVLIYAVDAAIVPALFAWSSI